MKPSLVRFLAAIGGLAFALIAYNVISSPSEKINGGDTTTWMLAACKRDVALPVDITEKNIVNSSYWSGFGDFEVIIQIKCDPVTVRKYRDRCINEFTKAEKIEEVPNQFMNVNYDIWFSRAMKPSIGYDILFSESDDSSILIRQIKG